MARSSRSFCQFFQGLLSNENFLEREQLLRVDIRGSGKFHRLYVAGLFVGFLVKRIGNDEHPLRISLFSKKIDERLRLQLRDNKLVDGQNIPGVDAFAQRFSKSESTNGLSNFLRIIARLRAKNDATAPPNRRRFVTGPGTARSFLPPWL